jgi:hypothetical protein
VIFYFKRSQLEGGLLRNIFNFIISTLLRISLINYFAVNYNQRPYREVSVVLYSLTLNNRKSGSERK